MPGVTITQQKGTIAEGEIFLKEIKTAFEQEGVSYFLTDEAKCIEFNSWSESFAIKSEKE